MSGNKKKGKAVRGFVRGLLWGSLAAAGGLAVVSQVAGPPVAPPVDQTQGAGPAPERAIAEVVPDDAPVSPAPESVVPEAAVGDPVPEPSADAIAPLVVTDAPPAPDSADTPVAAPIVPAPADTPSAQPLAEAPVSPEADRAVIVAPAPAEPPPPPPSDAPVGRMTSAGQSDPPAIPVAGDAPLTAAQPDAPDLPETEGAPAPADLPPPPPLTPEEEALLLPLPEEPSADPAPAEPELADPTPEPTAPPDLTDEAGVGEGSLPPAPGLTDEAPGVVTGRLPRIGATPAPAGAEQPAGAVPDTEADENLPPLRRFARPFENPRQKPLFAILLQDNGQEGVNRAELAALDLPLSIVIDPLSEGAAERAAIWRAGGQEVVMAGSGIPAGAGPGDLEQSFQVLATRLPEAVAVIDPDGRAFQNNRPLAAQVVPILAEQGRGLVTFDQGLNTADQVARREGLAAATIFRSIDGGNEGSPVIRRYLDRAVFKAAQEGRVIVIGALRPETVAGIMEWTVEGRASTVALAPVSALLRK